MALLLPDHSEAAALGRPDEPAAEAVAELISDRGLRTRLRDVGVERAHLDLIAEGSMHDR